MVKGLINKNNVLIVMLLQEDIKTANIVKYVLGKHKESVMNANVHLVLFKTLTTTVNLKFQHVHIPKFITLIQANANVQKDCTGFTENAGNVLMALHITQDPNNANLTVHMALFSAMENASAHKEKDSTLIKSVLTVKL